jgi:pyridoxal phosphate enzyme (YggS family)
MAHLFTGLTVERVQANFERVRAEVAAAAERVGREEGDVEILAACKYVPCEELPVLAAAGITLVGENRVQALTEKVAAQGERFTWDFIGTLQSKHVRAVVPHVRLIHSLATESALRELARQADRARPGMEVLVEVNLAADPSKQGIAPEQLPGFIDRSPFPVAGLMTMPPLAPDPEESRPWFRRLRELAREHGLRDLSMGTTQDFPVAVEEGATIVRIGTRLYS